jgi:hypothetical protein
MFKKTISGLFPFALLMPVVRAQVTEITESMSFGNRPGYRILVKDADPKVITAKWEEYLKNNYGAKTKKGKGGELVSGPATGGVLGTSTGTIYSRVDKVGSDVAVFAWFDNGTAFISGEAAPEGTKSSLSAFQMDSRKATVANEVSNEEKELKKLTDRVDKLKKDNTSLAKDIETYKKKITDAESNIAKNQREQDALTENIKTQQDKLDNARVRLKNVETEN